MATDQKVALMNIYQNTLRLLAPSEVTISVPIMGEKTTGVRNDTPNSP